MTGIEPVVISSPGPGDMVSAHLGEGGSFAISLDRGDWGATVYLDRESAIELRDQLTLLLRAALI